MLKTRKLKNIFFTISALSVISISTFFIIYSIVNKNGKHTNNNNNTDTVIPESYISTIFDNTITYNPLPYCTNNVNALCATNVQNYTIYTNASDLSITTTIIHSRIKGIHFGSDWNSMNSAPNNFCRCLFSNNKNYVFDVNLPKNIATVGNYFCQEMFAYSNVTSLDDNFMIPTNITTAGDNFCYKMFTNCQNLIVLPKNLNIPNNLTSTTGSYFCARMFAYCYSLKTIPYVFSLIRVSNNNAADIYSYMFYKSGIELTTNPTYSNLYIPQCSSGNTRYCIYMFECPNISNQYWTPQPNTNMPILRS